MNDPQIIDLYFARSEESITETDAQYGRYCYRISYILKLPHQIAAPAGMIGASNFFELAVAVAVALFGTTSPAALATTVGVQRVL